MVGRGPDFGCRRTLEPLLEDPQALHHRLAFATVGEDGRPLSSALAAAYRVDVDSARLKRFGSIEHLVSMAGIAPNTAVGRPDAELAAEGDEQAFARLVALHYRDMVQVAYVITGNGDLAQDATQSAWEIAWRKLGSIRDPLRVRPWLVSIAANEARQIVRRRGRVGIVELDVGLEATPLADPGHAIARLDLVRALTKLSPDDRALLALRYVLGLDAEELGSLTGRSASGTRARLSRLTARLRRELADDD